MVKMRKGEGEKRRYGAKGRERGVNWGNLNAQRAPKCYPIGEAWRQATLRATAPVLSLRA